MESGLSALKNGRQIFARVITRARKRGYAKSVIRTSALAAILVLVTAGTAFADGSTPESLAFSDLTRDESYVSWDDATTQTDEAGVAAIDATAVHGDYTSSTVTCEVCHSGHQASATGDSLPSETSENSCEPCHLGASAISRLKVSEGNGHGESGQCTNGYCHAASPHGDVGVSKYATLRTAMLTDNADSLLDAAIVSGCTGSPVQGNIFAADTDSVIATVSVYNPAVSAELLNDVSTAAAIRLGRSVGTGYVCANGGCHMDGQFNALTDDATFTVADGPITMTESQYVNPDYKGHTLAAVADLSSRGVAFGNVGACSDCHDSIDYRISATAKQFPHGNDRIDVDGTRLTGRTSVWFTVGAYLDSDDTTLTTNAKDSPLTAASDGACLKCHRSSSHGVGIDI